jgi:hypothetical protein
VDRGQAEAVGDHRDHRQEHAPGQEEHQRQGGGQHDEEGPGEPVADGGLGVDQGCGVAADRVRRDGVT